MSSLPFGKSSHTVKRVCDGDGGGVVTELDEIPPSTSSSQTEVYSGTPTNRQSDREFLRGYRPEPYTVRRTEMMVGGRRGRRRLDLSYMEGLMTTNTPPSLSSLPTPAQLCSKHTSISVGQRSDRKRTISKRDITPGIHEHLAHLHRKRKLCQLDNAQGHVSAQEVPHSPHHDLSVEENSLTFHSTTPLKPSFLHGGFLEESMTSSSLSAGYSARYRSLDIEQQQTQQQEQQQGEDNKEELGQEFEFKPHIRQSYTVQGLDHGASSSGSDEGREMSGFRPRGIGLDRDWLRRHTYRHFGQHAREEGRLSQREGGLRVTPTTQGHYGGVPYHRPVCNDQMTGGFAEILLSPHHHESSLSPPQTPQEERTQPSPHDAHVLHTTTPDTESISSSISSRERRNSSTLDHMMELCFNAETFALRNHFPREE